MISSFKDPIWLNNFHTSHQSYDNSFNTQMDSGIDFSSNEFHWRNYFEEEAMQIQQDFSDQLTCDFTWKDYFNTEETGSIFQIENCFKSREEKWITATDLFEPFIGVTLEDHVDITLGSLFDTRIVLLPPQKNWDDLANSKAQLQQPQLQYDVDLNCNSINIETIVESMDETSKLTKEMINTGQNSASNSTGRSIYYTEKHQEWSIPKFKSVTSFLTLKSETPLNLIEKDVVVVEKIVENVLSDDKSSTEDEDDELKPLFPDSKESYYNLPNHCPALQIEIIEDTENYCSSPNSSELHLASVPEMQEPMDSDDGQIYESPVSHPPLLSTCDLPSAINLKPISKIKRHSIPRPFSSQGLFYDEQSEEYQEDSFLSLLQVPSTYFLNSKRRTSEPNLPKLSPPRLLKTLPDESKFWAVRNNNYPWDFEANQKHGRVKSPLKKLKKIPHNRSRSAAEKPTHFDMDGHLSSISRSSLPSPNYSTTNHSPAKLSEFKFSKLSGKVTPVGETETAVSKSPKLSQKGIQSKMKNKKPKHWTRNKRSHYKKKLIPAIRDLFKGTFTSESSAKVTPEIESEYSLVSNLTTNSCSNLLNYPTESSSIMTMRYEKNYLHGHGIRLTTRPKGADPRRRSPWVRFLRYWDIHWTFSTESRKTRPKNRVSKSHK